MPATDPRLENEARYDRMAPAYERIVRLGSLGAITRLYRAVAAELDVPAGGLVVEIGCGPGTVTPHLRAVLDDSVRILGIDLSGRMIDLARQRAERAGWSQVEYVKADATRWEAPGPVDAVVFCLVLSGLPEPLRCVDRALSWLAPGGQLVVMDSLLVPGRRLANWVVRTKAPRVGAVPEDLPLDALLDRLGEPRTRSFLMGSYVLVSGCKPKAAQG
ncbi:MAG: hypothetical protein CL910_04395 [Deltaproteobacteria bacterium]|jgi:ubiquinone/menaquinone biosynthesis C-methylase UbiE|nr:hypothetical protein [Deltaproteobacteria bacterium]